MRPTPGEEIGAIKSMLTEVVVPAVSAPYPSTVLAAALSALARLERRWDTSSATIADEIAELEALLGTAASTVDSPGGGFTALTDCHNSLREALEARIISLDGSTAPGALDEVAWLRAYLRRAAGRWTA